jgi:membrane-associated phospholipid phosphatase
MFVLACARIPAGAHYPSDVVAGFSIGAIMALVIARWLARRRAVFSFDGDATLPRLNR